MVRDPLGVFQQSAVFQICGDAGRSHRMTAYPRPYSSPSGSPLHHSKHVNSVHSVLRELTSAVDRAKKRAVQLFADIGGLDVRIEIRFGIMVSRHVVVFSPFFMEAKPHSPSLREVVFDIHSNDRRDSGEAVNHHAD